MQVTKDQRSLQELEEQSEDREAEDFVEIDTISAKYAPEIFALFDCACSDKTQRRGMVFVNIEETKVSCLLVQ